ncbi:MAG: glycosyltransferase family 2 protein [Bacteroidota bacterium]
MSVAKKQGQEIGSQPLVSVLMPCYNAEAFLVEAIESILNQTYRNLEVVLLDDGSKDQTKNIISDYAKRDSRVKPVFNDSNLGLIRTLNKGLDLSSGDYIARMDADDVSLPHRIEVLVGVLEADKSLDLASAGCYSLSESGHKMARVYPKACTAKGLKFVCFFSTPVLHPCVLFRKSLMIEDRFDEEYLHSEDYEIFSRLLLKGKRFVTIEVPLYMLRKNFQSVSHKFESIQISTHNRISFRNIHDYFSRQYDYFVQRVMINRINFSVPPDLLLKSISNLRYLRDEFVLRENPTAEEVSDIDGFLTEQFIDIHLQSLKNSHGFLKLYHLISCLADANVFLSPRGRRYMRSKTWIKRKPYQSK